MIDRPLYVDKIMAYVDTPFVKILTGVRRCGKSTILKMIMERLKTERNIPEDRIISCRFDSMEYEDMTAKQIYTLLKEKLSPAGKTYLFLDEVQEIKGWEKIVNSLASDFDVDLYITGSNSRMMSSEIATYLTGGSRKQNLPIMSAWAGSQQLIYRRILRMKSIRLSGIYTTPQFFRIL